jgi:hypothetical protein
VSEKRKGRKKQRRRKKRWSTSRVIWGSSFVFYSHYISCLYANILDFQENEKQSEKEKAKEKETEKESVDKNSSAAARARKNRRPREKRRSTGVAYMPSEVRG